MEQVEIGRVLIRRAFGSDDETATPFAADMHFCIALAVGVEIHRGPPSRSAIRRALIIPTRARAAHDGWQVFKQPKAKRRALEGVFDSPAEWTDDLTQIERDGWMMVPCAQGTNQGASQAITDLIGPNVWGAWTEDGMSLSFETDFNSVK
jgi:hypothetical protein